MASSGQEWQFHISNDRAHIGTSTGRSNPILVSSARHHGIVYYGLYVASIVDSSRKGGDLLLFFNI